MKSLNRMNEQKWPTCKEPHPFYWEKKTDWLGLVATSRAMFTNHFSDQFFSRFASLPAGRKPNFWSYMLRLHTGAVCGLWFLLAIGSVGVFEIFTNHAKNMDPLRNWISTEIVTGIRHTSKKYIDLALEWVMPPAHKQTCYSYVDKMLGNHFEGEESQKPIPWKQWLPWLDPPETPCPWLGTPTWEFQEMASLPCGHWVKMKQAAFTPAVLEVQICYREN